MPEDLLDEVTALVEWPVPLVCSFEERYLQVIGDEPVRALVVWAPGGEIGRFDSNFRETPIDGGSR